jgi:uncharacterized protein (TIGR02302 family)
MTRLSQWTKSRTGSDGIRRLVETERLILAFERLWPRLWPASGIAGLFLLLALSGLLPLVPWPLHALALAGFVTALGLALNSSLPGFSWPAWRDGARRLERDSALAHRPISEADDTLAAGVGDATAEELWRAAQAARLSRIGPLRLSPPRPGLSARDPHGLRFYLLAALALALALTWGHWGDRIAGAFGPAAGEAPTVDAWIDPPDYTGEAPVYLPPEGGTVRVPAGSRLTVRVHGGATPFLSLQSPHFPWLPMGGGRLAGTGGEYVSTMALAKDATVRIRAEGRTLGRWTVFAVPDRAPSIAFAAPPGQSERDALKLSFAAHDDYAVTAVRAIIRPVKSGRPPLIVDLSVPPGKDIAATVYRDLTAHPYAGLEVTIVLEATDAAGQIGTTAPVRFKLPELVFTDPLARALIEVRRMLAENGFAARDKARRILDALAFAPERFYDGQPGVYLALRSGFWGLKFAGSDGELARVETLLWQTAASLERGGLMPLAEALRRTQEALAQLLAAGAPQSQVDVMLQRYAALMQRYLEMLATRPGEKAPATDGGKMLAPKDLADLLTAVQTLSESGDREKATELLSFLQNLIENMQVAGGSGKGGAGAGSAAVRDLSDLIGRERQLLDKTFRESQEPRGGAKGLAGAQGALKTELNGIRKKTKPDSHLAEAERLMGEAQKALAMGDLPRAGTFQKYVLDALRKGAAALAGEAPDSAGRSDPFGRAAGTRGQMPIPDASVLKRTRDILKDLRKKSGEMNRPQEERDYIDRLLKEF